MRKKIPDPDVVIKKLAEKALADGVITEEEKAIINAAKFNFLILESFIKQALADGILDRKEWANIGFLESEVLRRAWEVAEADSVISEDEKALLDTLLHLIRSERKNI